MYFIETILFGLFFFSYEWYSFSKFFYSINVKYDDVTGNSFGVKLRIFSKSIRKIWGVSYIKYTTYGDILDLVEPGSKKTKKYPIVLFSTRIKITSL